jgi:zinc protease
MTAGLFGGVRKTVLDNGMTVIVNEDRSSGVVALEMFVKVGSNHETDDVWGWSHGIEHMLFKGTERRGGGDVAREVSELGGMLNAGTWYESTSYYIVVPSDGFDHAVDIHADVLKHSAFRSDALDLERGVLVEELNMYRDIPDGVGFTLDELMSTAFIRHRYRRSVIGSVESLRETPREAIVDYFRRGYRASNMIYVVAGDVDADEAFAAIADAFGDMPPGEAELPTPVPEPEQTGFRHVALTGDVEAAYFKIGFHVPEETHPDMPALRVLGQLLGAGRSSRFHRRIVEEQGLVSQIGLVDVTGLDPGLLIIDGASEVADLEAALAAVYVEIQHFHRNSPRPEDLEKALNTVIAGFVSALESVQGQSSVLGHFEILGDYRLGETYAARIAEVTPDDVVRVASQYLRLEASTVLTYTPGPTGGHDRAGEAVLEARLRERIAASAGGAEARADRADAGRPIEVPAIAPSASGPDGEVVERTLPGEARLLVRRRPKLPTVALAVYGRAGLRFESRERQGASSLAARCLIKGTRTRSDEALAEEMERYAITLRPLADRDTAGFYVECLTGQLPRALDLFAEVLTEPAFGHDPVERERALTLADIRQEQDDTASVTMDAFRRRLFSDHPYGWNPLGTESSVRAIEREDLVAWHRRFFVMKNLSFAAVGDVDPLWLERELAARLASVPLGPAPAAPAMALRFPSRGEECRITRDKEQAVIVLGVPAPSLHADARFPLYVLDHILSDMSGRLFEELRNKRHLCYHTQSFYMPMEDAGAFGGFVGTSPERVEEAIDVLRAELERTREEPPTDDELRRSIAAITGNRLISMQSNGRQAAALARRQALGPGYAEVLRFPERIGAVTAADVLEVARSTLDLDRAVLAVLTARRDPVERQP